MSAAAWDPRWSLRAPTTTSASTRISYASWKRRVQALLEAEGVWEVVSEGVVFDETWPLPKQLEFIQKDKLGMHLILGTVHDSVVALLLESGSSNADESDECNRSWLMFKRLEAVFAAHRMKAVRVARREFLGLNFVDFARASSGGNGTGGSASGSNGELSEADAMQRFVDVVQTKGDALFRLRGHQVDGLNGSECDDEKIYQLLDALPASWLDFIAQECESQGDLTWASLQRKVLNEYTKRHRADGLRKRLLGGSSVPAISVTPAVAIASAGSDTGGVAMVSSRDPRSRTTGAQSAGVSQNQDDAQSSSSRNGVLGYQQPGTSFSIPLLAAKAEPSSDNQQQHNQEDDHYDLRSEDDLVVYDFVGQPQQEQQPVPYQQQQQHQSQASMPSYQSHHQQQQDQYYDHNPRPKAFEKSYKNNARNNRRDVNGQQRTPYSRPPPNTPKVCFYCSVPGHTVQQCSLKTMHVAQRKRQQQQ